VGTWATGTGDEEEVVMLVEVEPLKLKSCSRQRKVNGQGED